MKKAISTKRKKFTGHHVEKTTKLLAKLASQFPKNAKEYQAIELAAKALLFASQRGTAVEFKSFLKNFDSELTPKQKKHLRSLGIDV